MRESMNRVNPMSNPPAPPSSPLAPGEVALVGTVHMDRGSYRALRDLVVALRPQVVASEMSQFGLRFRRTEGRRLRSKILQFLRRSGLRAEGDLQATLWLLSLPYEYLAAVRAARRIGARVAFLGRDRDSRVWLSRLLHQDWSQETLEGLARAERRLHDELDAEIRRAQRLEREGIRPGPRDRVYAEGIEALAHQGLAVVGVLGWEHLVASVPGTTAWYLHAQVVGSWLVAGGEARFLG